MMSVTSTLGAVRGALKSALYSGPWRDRWQQPHRVLSALEMQPGQQVADLGAGGGYFTYRLARAVGEQGTVYAVDPDPDMTARIAARAARKGYTNIQPVEPDAEGPPLPTSVDLVVIVDAFHHLPAEASYYADLAEQLTAEGRVAVIEALPRWYLFGHATEPDRIRSTLSEAGYRLTSEHDFLARQSFLVFTKPQ